MNEKKSARKIERTERKMTGKYRKRGKKIINEGNRGKKCANEGKEEKRRKIRGKKEKK